MPSHYQRSVTDPGKSHDRAGACAHGIEAGETLYVAGRVAMNTEAQIVHADDPQGQFRLNMKNSVTIVETAGGQVDDIVKLLAFMEDVDHREGFQVVPPETLKIGVPTVTLVEVSRLAVKDTLMECEAVAINPAAR